MGFGARHPGGGARWGGSISLASKTEATASTAAGVGSAGGAACRWGFKRALLPHTSGLMLCSVSSCRLLVSRLATGTTRPSAISKRSEGFRKKLLALILSCVGQMTILMASPSRLGSRPSQSRNDAEVTL
eukprot:1405565-Rhodomonas_salina.1